MRNVMRTLWGAARRGPLGRAWDRIREPRHAKAVYTLAFCSAFSMGAAAIISPPTSIEGVIGTALTYTWGIFLVTGGVLGAFSTIPGWWMLERLGIFAIMIGVVIYGAVVWQLQMESTGNRFPQWFALVSIVLLWIPEIVRTWGHNFEPKG